MDENQKEKIASEIIRKWRENPDIREQYNHNLGFFAIHEEIKIEWKNSKKTRIEFNNDFKAFEHFKLNEHRTNIIGGKVVDYEIGT